MTSAPDRPSRLANVVRTLDWLATMGARTLFAAAALGAVAAVSAWALIATGWGVIGVVLLVAALTPAAVLFFYARGLREAVDATRLELSVGELTRSTVAQAADVVGAARSGRFRLMRAGWRVLTAVRQLHEDVSQLGVDFGALASIANPTALSLVGGSLLAVAGISFVVVLIALALLVF